jgi:hypothetical protein
MLLKWHRSKPIEILGLLQTMHLIECSRKLVLELQMFAIFEK